MEKNIYLKMKKHSQSPLPFQGQKRNFLKEFKTELKNYPDNAIYVDLFGGSGLLSHTVKQVKPNATVIYNDYDNFKQRLQAVSETNKLLDKFRTILIYTKKGDKVLGEKRNQILQILKDADVKGFVDYITISSNILFSMNYATSLSAIEKQTLYSKVRKSNYNAEDYLKGVNFVKSDYKKLFEKYRKNDNVVFLVDPPYLSTDCSTYKNYWKLADYLDVLKVLYNNNYFYFTSNKSSVVELCEWIETNTGGTNPFSKAKIVYQYNKTTHNTGYTDIMLHKRYTTTTT